MLETAQNCAVLVKQKENKMEKPVKEIEKEYNRVIHETDTWLHSLDIFLEYDILAIVNGILYSVFNMIYRVAPNFEIARQTIENALDHFESELEEKPKARA